MVAIAALSTRRLESRYRRAVQNEDWVVATAALSLTKIGQPLSPRCPIERLNCRCRSNLRQLQQGALQSGARFSSGLVLVLPFPHAGF